MTSREQSIWPVAVKGCSPHTISAFLITESASLQWPLVRVFPEKTFPPRNRSVLTSMTDIVQHRDELSESDYSETLIVDQHRRCIDHWNTFLDALPEDSTDDGGVKCTKQSETFSAPQISR